MTKTARLFFIMDHLRQGKTFSVGDLASICDISQRTVFRDIRDLQKLEVPIHFDDGYRLASAKRQKGPLFDKEGYEILRFALSASPLAGISVFDKKLKSLETKLKKLCDSPEKSNRSVFCRRLNADRSGQNSVDARQSRMIAILWRRSLERLPVSLTLKPGSSRKLRTLSGRAEQLIWREGRWALRLRRSKPSRLLFIDIDQITSIQLPSQRTNGDSLT